MTHELTTSRNYGFTIEPRPIPKINSTLEERIEELRISDEDASALVSGKAAKTIRDKLLGLLPFGDALSTLLNFHEEVEDDLRDKKKEILLSGALQKLEAHGDAIGVIGQLISNPYGSTLLSKILQIADDTPPDVDLLKHLSSAIAHIADTDFERLFDEHKFVLGIIDRLSPQALAVIAKSKDWPPLNYVPFTATAGRASDDWRRGAADQLSALYGFSDANSIGRLEHVFAQLERENLLFGHCPGDSKTTTVELTTVGKQLLPYLDKS